MKLYLSSYQLGNEPKHLLSLLGKNKRAAIIQNAADGFGDEQRASYTNAYIESLASLNIAGEELDLRNFFGQPDRLETYIKTYGLLWVVGGNTFVLRSAMRQSGFDRIIGRLLDGSDLVYGGFSAGICVLSPSLKGIHLADEPEKIPRGYPNQIIWEGLGLLDFSIAPHFRSNHHESHLMEAVVEYYENNNMPYYALADGEAVVINGDSLQIVGKSIV